MARRRAAEVFAQTGRWPRGTRSPEYYNRLRQEGFSTSQIRGHPRLDELSIRVTRDIFAHPERHQALIQERPAYVDRYRHRPWAKEIVARQMAQRQDALSGTVPATLEAAEIPTTFILPTGQGHRWGTSVSLDDLARRISATGELPELVASEVLVALWQGDVNPQNPWCAWIGYLE